MKKNIQILVLLLFSFSLSCADDPEGVNEPRIFMPVITLPVVTKLKSPEEYNKVFKK